MKRIHMMGCLPWTSFQKMGFETAAIEEDGQRLPWWVETKGETIKAQVDRALLEGRNWIRRFGCTRSRNCIVTVTLKRGENFDEMKPVFKRHFPNGFPARNTILVDEFLNASIKLQIEAIAYKPQ